MKVASKIFDQMDATNNNISTSDFNCYICGGWPQKGEEYHGGNLMSIHLMQESLGLAM